MSPYRSVQYHLKEFSDRPPENEQELFFLRHSSLRTTIERGFGVVKKRFRVLDAEPFWSFPTQVKVVLACCVVHNHIMGVEPNDHIMEDAMNQVEFSDRPPEHAQELFNLRHSSVRTTSERGGGVLVAEPVWSFPTQVKVVLACCVVHNHIMGVEPNDHIMEDAMNEVESSDQIGRASCRERV